MEQQETPLISILIPAYNAEQSIRDAINSIITQTYEHLEIILLDDGSTDSTREIMKTFKDNRIKSLYLNDNTKKIGIVNQALKELVTGDYFTFQDADDWSAPTRIEEQLNFLRKCNLDITYVGGIYYDETLKEYRRSKNKTLLGEAVFNYFDLSNEDEDKLDSIICATMFAKRKILETCPGYHPYFIGKPASDLFWNYQILSEYKGGVLANHLYHIVRSRNSFTTTSISNTKSQYVREVIKRIIEYKRVFGHDLLSPEMNLELKEKELEACEATLTKTKATYEQLLKNVYQSKSYIIGNKMVRLLKALHF